MTVIRRARRLPAASEILVRVGQEIGPIQIIARAPGLGNFQVLRASEVLNVPADALKEHLLVEEGMVLERGTPLMRKQTLLGRAKLYRSPIDGVVQAIRDGCLIIRKGELLVELRSMMRGRVVTLIPDRGVVLETHGTMIEAVGDSGKDGFGKLKMAVDSPWDPFDGDLIDSRVHGTILVAGRIERLETLTKLEENGGRGIIAGSMPAKLLVQAAALSLPVIVTDGTGRLPMSEMIFEMLQQSEGREASLLASESGVHGQRAEIVISLPVTQSYEMHDPAAGVVEIGKKVRVLRLGHRPLSGEVTKVYLIAKKSALGIKMPGADVKLADGKELFVPYSNIDVIT